MNVTLYNLQIFSAVCVKGNTFRATAEFRGNERYDCVRLKHKLKTGRSRYYTVARIMWIMKIPGDTDEPICLAVPLFENNKVTGDTQAQKKVFSSFETVYREPHLVAFPVKCIFRLEQVQFFVSHSCNLGIINHFYHSKIVHSDSLSDYSDNSSTLVDSV